jgi:DNA-directed RNA polymerase subunit beta
MCDGEQFHLDLMPERLQGETASFDIGIGDRVLLRRGQRSKPNMCDLVKAGYKASGTANT